MPMTAVRTCIGSSPSARRFRGAGLLPVDEQEPAGCVELRLARSGQDLQLQLFDLVFRAIPAGERGGPGERNGGEQQPRGVPDRNGMYVRHTRSSSCESVTAVSSDPETARA